MSLNAKPKHLRDNRFLDGTPTATDTDSDSQYDVLNIKDWRYYTLWKAGGSGTKYLYPNATGNFDSLFLMNHNLNTANATVSVEYSATGAWAGEELEALAGFTPPDDYAIIKTMTPRDAYSRIKIVTAAVTPYIGIALLGEIFTWEKYPHGNFDPNTEKIKAETNKSMAGYPLGTIVDYYEHPLNISFRRLTPSWVTNTFAAEWTHMRQLLPIAFAPDITNHPTEVYYGSLPPKFTKSMPYDPVRRSLKLTLDTIVEE